MNEIMMIKGVRGRMNPDGYAELNLEDSAKGLGIVKRDVKNGITYERAHKQNLQKWLFDFGLIKSEKEDLPDFIPEGIFYRLCFKAENEAARNFQNTVFDEVLPAIRKHGMYATPQAVERMLEDPDTMIVTLQKLKEERERRMARSGQQPTHRSEPNHGTQSGLLR